MIAKKARTFICDFETTVFEGQTFTEVWASACVEMFTDDVLIFHSIDEQFEYFKSLKCNVIGYYHNLKFDGSFWLPFLIQKLNYKQALLKTGEDERDVEWMEDKYMRSKMFKYSISERGAWYSIKIKVGEYFIEFRDSLKLLPFSVEEIGKAFQTKHRKLTMEYAGIRWAGCPISDKEKEYIANDVLVVKEAMEIMHEQGHKNLTIGACCLKEYKHMIRHNEMQDNKNCLVHTMDYNEMFPDLYAIPVPDEIKEKFSAEEQKIMSADYYIRKSYHGGYCYVVAGKENKVYKDGTTGDVNSLYPSMMSSESGNPYPIGKPTFWNGNTIPKQALQDNTYYFIRFRTRFYLKEGMLPTVQIKHSMLYDGTDWLKTSDVYDSKTGKYYTRYPDGEGNMCDTAVTLTMTQTDFILFKEHYELVNFEILDGCYFYTTIGLFDSYIEKYKKIKLESKGALRTLAKLFLNNLYGKMAASDDSSYKIAYVKDNETIAFFPVLANDKKPGYIPVGSAITSYARNFTIRAAQKNYYGVNERGFIYADTDSIHCDLQPEELKGIKVHDKNFCCWKLEASWDTAIFTRQKTYIEHVIKEDLETIEEPYFNIKCAGMGKHAKEIFNIGLNHNADYEGYIDKNGIFKEWTTEEKQYLFDPETLEPIEHDITEFKVGVEIPGNLKQKRIKGGVVLYEMPYKMK